jgi:hypothetical protein
MILIEKPNKKSSKEWWLPAVTLATWEDEIGRIKIRSQPGQIVHETPSLK